MPGSSATPSQIADVVAQREAGFTVAVIAEKTRLSVSTVKRIIAEHGARKGAAKEELVEKARSQLRSLIASPDAVAEEASKLIADDLAHAKLLRERISEAAENLQATNLKEAVLFMRAAAAMSTALKNTSDMVRHSLAYDRDKIADDDLPVLQVLELSDEQIQKMREKGLSSEEGDEQVDEGEPLLSHS